MDVHDQVDSAVDALVAQFFKQCPQEATAELEQMESREAAGVLADLPAASRVQSWEALSVNAGAEVLQHYPEDGFAAFLHQVSAPGLAVRLSRLGEEEREQVLARCHATDAAEIRKLLEYPSDTAGQLMDTRVLAMRGQMSVAQAIEALRRQASYPDVSEIKIVDENNLLVSIVDIRDLALAQPQQALDSIATGVTAVVFAMDPKQEVVEALERHKLEELPVVSHEGALLGVIRHSQLIDALRESVSLDIQTMVGASKDERATSSSGFAFRKRVGWLHINLLTAFLAAAVVGLFESTIAQFTALAVLLPVVAGQSGNAGTQALAVTMRGLALREISTSQWSSVTGKELRTGLWNGLAVAATCGLGVYIWSQQLGLVIVIASSMVIAMVAAGMAGALVPITLERLGQDPAVASSILLTTVTDIVGFFAFLGIATVLSGMLV